MVGINEISNFCGKNVVIIANTQTLLLIDRLFSRSIYAESHGWNALHELSGSGGIESSSTIPVWFPMRSLNIYVIDQLGGSKLT